MKSKYLLTFLIIGLTASANEKAPDQTATAAMNAFYSRFSASPQELQTQLPGVYNRLCVGDHEDPMDFGSTMQSGAARGECQDLSQNRPVAILAGDETTPTMTIVNLRYKGRFWIATFKKNSVSKVQFEIINFGSQPLPIPGHVEAVTAHTQVRFQFKEPIELESLVVDETTPPMKAQLSDLTFTYNAYGVHGVPYDTNAGLTGTFGILGKAIATADRSVEEILHDQSRVQLYEMDFTHISQVNRRSVDDNMYHYLATNLAHSQTIGYTGVYHTILRNCTTEAFDVMDLAFPELLAGNAPGSRAVPFLRSYSFTKNLRVKLAQLGEEDAASLKGPVHALNDLETGSLGGLPSPSSLVPESIRDFQIPGLTRNIIGAAANIRDLVVMPSIQNLIDRRLVKDSDAKDLKQWDQQHVSYLNDEAPFNSKDALCAAAETCLNPNLRNTDFPLLKTKPVPPIPPPSN